jgi:hypothetical protein
VEARAPAARGPGTLRVPERVLFRALALMVTQSDHLTKLRCAEALQKRATRIAVLIVENICGGMDLIDEQRPPVIEAVIEHIENKECQKAQFRAVRKPLIEYAKVALKEARACADCTLASPGSRRAPVTSRVVRNAASR